MEQLEVFFYWLIVAMGVALALGAVGLALMWRSIKGLNVPPTAGYFTTMRAIPLPLVIVLDLLDFGLDVFAAPVSWIVLDRLGLKGLRNKAALEALIPFTQPIPTFTISWIAARTLDIGDEVFSRVIEGEASEVMRQLPR